MAPHFSHHASVRAHAVQYDGDRCANLPREANHQPHSLGSQTGAALWGFLFHFFSRVSNCVRCCCGGGTLNDNTCLSNIMDSESSLLILTWFICIRRAKKPKCPTVTMMSCHTSICLTWSQYGDEKKCTRRLDDSKCICNLQITVSLGLVLQNSQLWKRYGSFQFPHL